MVFCKISIQNTVNIKPWYKIFSKYELNQVKHFDNKLGARETPIGYVPHAQDINIKDLDIHSRDLVKLLELDISDLEQETLEINKFYNKTLENNIPVELRQELNNLQDNL